MPDRADEQGEPVTFDEVFDAATPRLRPGVSKQDFLDSLRHAAATGGHVPGRPVPDISMAPVVTDLSGSGIHPAIMKALAGGASNLEDVAGALAASQQGRAPEPPADPFGNRNLVAGTGLHEMFLDMTAGGFTEDQALTILARMLAAYGVMDKDGGE